MGQRKLRFDVSKNYDRKKLKEMPYFLSTETLAVETILECGDLNVYMT